MKLLAFTGEFDDRFDFEVLTLRMLEFTVDKLVLYCDLHSIYQTLPQKLSSF